MKNLIFNPQSLINSLYYSYNIKPKGHKYINPNPRKTNVLIFVEKGGIQFSSPFCEVFAKEGDFVLIPQGTSCSTIFSGEENITFIFYFMLTSPIQNKDIIHFKKNSDTTLIMEKIIKHQKTVNNNFYIISYLYRILNILNKNIASKEKYEKILPVVEYIATTFKETYPVSHYAKLCEMSETNFRLLFKELMGVTPIEYRTNLRVRCVEELVLDGAPITEAIFIAGFNNPTYYYRIKRK